MANVNDDGVFNISRFFNTLTGTHFFTASDAERDNIINTLPNFNFEGNVFDSNAVVGGDDVTSVFRFLNTETGVHFFTSSEAEKINVQNTLPQFNFEGVAYQAFSEPGLEREAVFRFFNTETGTHFYTSNEAEKINIENTLPQFNFEGINYYVGGPAIAGGPDPVDPTPNPDPENKTFALTNAIDNLGGNSGNDVFIGDKETTSPADTLVGAEGMDVLQLFGTNITPNISGIEKLVYITPGGDISVADFADVTSVELKNAVPGHTITTTQGQAVTLTNIDITFGNANGIGNSIRLAGDSVTALDLTLDKFGALGPSKAGELILDGDGLSTLNITGANNASVLTIDSSQQSTNLLKTLNIAGDQDVSIGGGDLTTIDASSATGRIAIQANATDLTFKGGSGDDTIRMGGTLTSGDTLTGGAGIDMLRVSNGNTVNSASAVANISEFEFFNTTGAGTYDLSFLNANNALIGLRVSSDNTTVNNINAASTNNIQITTESSLGLTPELDLKASDFIAGGTSDTATITLDNSRSQTGSGVNSDVDFDNLDVLNLISKSDGTPTKILSGDEQNSLRLNASDLEKIVVTGDEALFLEGGPNTLQLSEIDASGLDAPVHIRTDAVPSILAKGTTYDDIFNFGSMITAQTTLFTGGGSDQVFVTGASSTSAHTLSFTATELNAGDLKAGDATTVELESAEIGSTVTINLSSALEGLLKSGGTFLSATNANINIHGTSLSNTTNIAAIKSISPADDDRFFGHDLQFDLNGDGFFNAEDDAEISIHGDSVFDVNNTLVYDAAADALIYTVASGFVSF